MAVLSHINIVAAMHGNLFVTIQLTQPHVYEHNVIIAFLLSLYLALLWAVIQTACVWIVPSMALFFNIEVCVYNIFGLATIV